MFDCLFGVLLLVVCELLFIVIWVVWFVSCVCLLRWELFGLAGIKS